MRVSRKDVAKALGILAGCPDGATDYALAAHNITRACLHALVAAGHATVQLQRIARIKGLEVPRFRITEAGREALKRVTGPAI